MGQSSTIYNFDIELSDADRGVYEALALRVACHPSESGEFLVTRVLAYCLEFTEGLAFGKGLSEPDEPALAVRDLTGTLRAWIDIGAPDARHLHKAAKAAPRVVIYSHKDPAVLVRQLRARRFTAPPPSSCAAWTTRWSPASSRVCSAAPRSRCRSPAVTSTSRPATTCSRARSASTRLRSTK